MDVIEEIKSVVGKAFGSITNKKFVPLASSFSNLLPSSSGKIPKTSQPEVKI